ncbi:hypothetical protein ABK040_000692 [Willaertia magna]
MISTIEKQSNFQTYHTGVLNFIMSKECKLYNHQKEALLSLYNFQFNDQINNSTALLVLPTGTGKSAIVAFAPYVLQAKRVLIITPSSIISKQLDETIMGREGPSIYESTGAIVRSDLPKFVDAPHVMDTTKKLLSIDTYPVTISNAHKFGSNSSVKFDQIPRGNIDLLIVDEAHHFPAPTWKKIIDHFSNCRKVFLTATPEKKGCPILENQNNSLCYSLSIKAAIKNGIIRDMCFEEVGDLNDSFEGICKTVGGKVVEKIKEHNVLNPKVKHQVMILTNSVKEADDCVQYLSSVCLDVEIASYHSNKTKTSLDNFENGKIGILVVCGKLLEGYDNKKVSVVGILRNVQQSSRVLFTQFVGRCLRTSHSGDQVTACVISHKKYKQKDNFDKLNDLTEVEMEDDHEY